MNHLIIVGLALACAGCLNWQSAYDEAARRECRDILDADARRACLASAQAQAYDTRIEKRRQEGH